MLYIIRIANY